MAFFALVVTIAAIVYFVSRIGNLETRIAQLEAARTIPTEANQNDLTPISHNEANGQPISFTPIPVATQSTPAQNTFIDWLKEDFLMKVGALFLLAAFGWFVSYAFANNWIGPVGRIALGQLAGVSTMLLGLWRIQTVVTQGSIFMVVGSTVVLMTTYAARFLYDFFSPVTALFIMFAAIVFVAYVAVSYKTERLALASVILALVAPLLTAADEPSVSGLFLYLLAVVVGTVWIMVRLRSDRVLLASFLGVLLYSLPFIVGEMTEAETETGLLFGFVFTILFFVLTMAGLVQNKSYVSKIHLWIAGGTGLTLVGWVQAAVREDLQGIALISWSLAFALGAFTIYLRTNRPQAFYVFGTISAVLLGIATAIMLDGPVLIFAFFLETSALLLLLSRYVPSAKSCTVVALTYVLPILLSFDYMYLRDWAFGLPIEDFSTILVLLVGFTAVGRYLYIRSMVPELEGMRQVAVSLLIISLGYAVALVWLTAYAVLPADVAVTVSLLIYTIAGLTSYFYGLKHERTTIKITGAVLLGGVVARLLLIDVWQMGLTERIITFGLIGILLLSTAFFGRKKQRTDQNDNDMTYGA